MRNEKGRLESSSRKRKSLADHNTTFRKNGSLNENIFINKHILTNVIETTVSNTNNRISRRIKGKKVAQVGVSVIIDGKIISARSNKIGSSLSKTTDDAKEDALNNLGERISGLFLDETDGDEGLKYLKEKGIKIKYSAVYYTKK